MLLIVTYSIAVHACYIGSKIVVSLYALQLGASQVTIGVLAALYALVPLMLGVYAGRLADTRGTHWPLLGGAAVMGIGMIVSFFSHGMGALFATAILAGAGFVFFNVSIQTLTGGYGGAEDRARNFSILSIGYSISTFIGPVSVGLAIDYAGHAHAFLMLALFTVLPIIGLLSSKRFNVINNKSAAEDNRSALELLRLPPVRSVVIVSGLIVAAWDLFAFYLPVYAHSLNFSATTIGILLGVYAFAAFITRFAMPLLLQHWRGERVMFACLLFAACAFAAFPLSTNLYYMLAIAFCLGLGLGCGQPLSMMIAYNRSPEGREGEVTGLRLTANNVARVVIPVICGVLGTALGAAPVFWLNAVNLTAVSYLVWRQ
ncbi:MAG: MFS transporter [Burkholderiales bacterium]